MRTDHDSRLATILCPNTNVAQSKASVWHPYNVELAEEAAEEEADDTQEIQIEEALKLYAAALKFHSEGPRSFEQTAAAYKALFESDIFKYTESLSEYQRHEAFGEELVFDSILEEDFEAGPVQSTGAADSAPNTLPQILHLSYKNHGQFLLESMQYWISQNGTVSPIEAWNSTRGALNYFAEALDKEDTDLDLWLRAASVAAMLGSKRLTRYCLEAILDGNDEQWESLLQMPGLEEGFAGQQLQELVERLEDNVSLMQAPYSSMKRKKMSENLKKRLNPFPFARLPAEVASIQHKPAERPQESIRLSPTKWDWASVGEAILQQFMAEQRGMTYSLAPGLNINIVIPAHIETPEPVVLGPTVSTPDEVQKSLPPALTSLEKATELEKSADALIEAQLAAEQGDVDTIMEGEDGGSADIQDLKKDETKLLASAEAAPAPSRKRSTDSAGLPETAEGGRSRSKRIRGRDSILEPAAGGTRDPQDTNKQLEEQLEPYNHADQCLYEIVKDIYSRLGVYGIKEPHELRALVTSSPAVTASDPFDKAACDLFEALRGGKAKTAQILLSSESFDLLGVTREAGLNAFLGFAKSDSAQACTKPVLASEKLNAFARSINAQWLSTKEAAFAWMETLLSRTSLVAQLEDADAPESSYTKFRWAEDLKRNLVQIIVNLDDYIYERMLHRIDGLSSRILRSSERSIDYKLSDLDGCQIEIVESLLELHLDIYSLIKHPHSQVDANTQTLQSDRLERWSTLTREAMQLKSACQDDQPLDNLGLRHVWASVFQMSVNDEMSPEHVLSAMAELKSILQSLNEPTIQLQNNAVMPELSINAIDRELVRISMKDFFLKVFDQDEQDPVTVIESLEPILEPVSTIMTPSTATEASPADSIDAAGMQSSPTPSLSASTSTDVVLERPSPVVEMRKFLDSANVNVRLSLWHRLRVAYEAIEYPPKVVSCHLRSIESLVNDLKTPNFQDLSAVDRQIKLITRFRVIDDMVTKVLHIFRDEKSAFDCLDFEHVQSSMSAIAILLQIFSAGDMFRDLIRISQSPVPRIEALPNQAFTNMSNRLDDMHLRLWMLQYHLLKEGIAQEAKSFPTPSEDLFEFLRHVHHATGVRGYSHLSNRQFLRLAKDELLRLDDIIDANSHDTELCQVLHDLYGLKLFIEPLECQDFTTVPDALDKKTAFNILPFVMSQTGKVNLKDLPKTELKVAIEKVHAALGRPKQHDDITFNRKVVNTYFKSPVSPVSLYSCLNGVGSLPTKTIAADEAVAASKGWYFMMGNIALNKFRSQKRMTQGPTEDLNYAQAFFLQDLEYSTESWETWYRLAQANDTQLEEAVSWNADKLNSNTVELVNYQRAAINCYIMAAACAVRNADASSPTQSKIAQMYLEFGNRMYASSREPFSMEAFQIRESEKRFCNSQNQTGTYKDVVFQPLVPYTAWKLASTLFKRATRGLPNKWWNYYMLGKCQWKMWKVNRNEAQYALSVGAPPPRQQGPTWETIIDSITSAVETLPDKKGRSSEPVLEPHYKLVSIAYKLFHHGAIGHEQGVEVLTNTRFSKDIEIPECADDWDRYIQAVLKTLRTADKSSWHHRIIARSAHVFYEQGKDPKFALAAKHELTQQIFTKTMAVQVWKPENERPGRHFVYTTRYTRYFVELLDLTGDKTNFEALAKRVRRKQSDFFEHQKLWQDLCLRYLRLLRKMGQVPDGQEDAIFKSVNHEEFNILALRLETWCQTPTTQHPVLDVLRDAIELKRLNNGLMKSLLIDDLIGDTYAMLYTLVGPTLPPLPSEQQQQPHQPAQSAVTATGPPTSTSALSISSLMQVQVDGATEAHGNTPFSMYHPNQLQLQHPTSVVPTPTPTEQPAKPRAKTVGRREVGRRAEACLQKISVPSVQTTSIPIRSPPTLNATLASLDVRTSSPEKSVHPMQDPGNPSEHLQVPFDRSGPATAAPSVADDEPERSVPGSFHDDADDESELSELDEEEVQEIEQEVENDALRRSASIATIKPLFPKLMANRQNSEQKSLTAGEGAATAPEDEADHSPITSSAVS
ncbi:Histone transcription regulator 3 [Coniothyrium glycines]